MRLVWTLIVLIAAEVAVGAWLVQQRLAQTTPPVPSFVGFPDYTAEQIRKTISELDRNSAEDWIHLGKVYLAHGFFPEGEACYREAVNVAPDSPEARYQWGFCLSTMGQLPEARDQFHLAITLGYENPAACWYFLGLDALRAEQVDEAREAFRQAAELPASQYELARLDLRAGKPETALPVIQRLQNEFPRVAMPHFLRGRAELALGNDEQAEAFFEMHERTSDVLPSPWQTETVAINNISEEMSVRELVRSATELLQSGQVEQAAELVQEQGGEQWNPFVQDIKSEIAHNRGDTKEQIRILTEVIEKDGADSYRLCRLGFALLGVGQVEEAKQTFETALSLASGVRGRELIDMCEQMAELAAREGDTKEARRMAAKAHYLQGMDYMRWLRIPEAEQAMQRAVELNPSSPYAWFYLAESRMLIGNVPGARVAYQQCLKLDPSHGRARRALDRMEREVSNSPG